MITNRTIYHFATFVFAISLLTSCSKRSSNLPDTTADTTNKLGIIVANNFNYQTTNTTSLDVSLLTNDNKPLPGVMVNILDKPAAEGGKIHYTTVSDANGKVAGAFKLPTYIKTVTVNPGYVGLMHDAAVAVVGNKVSCTLGGSTGYLGNVIPGARIINSGMAS
ncbi:MAG: hypothetical protein ABIN89_22340 [Chitinophagaceae bacterium]